MWLSSLGLTVILVTELLTTFKRDFGTIRVGPGEGAEYGSWTVEAGWRQR